MSGQAESMDMEVDDWPEEHIEGRAEELEDVLEFVHRLSVDAMMRGNAEMQKAYDELEERLRREDHRR